MDYLAFVYCWIYLPTGEYYIGKHKGNTDDGYIGSGIRFRNKWRITDPKDWFRKILYFCKSDEEANKKEAKEVDKVRLKDPLCLNLIEGGQNIGSYWKPKKWLSTEIIHPIHGEIRLNKYFKASDWARHFYPKDVRRTTNAINRVLVGFQLNFDKWAFRDSQLYNRIKNNLEIKNNWRIIYLKRSDNKVMRIFRNSYSKDLGKKKTGLNNGCIYNIMNGSQVSIKGWSKATRQDWNNVKLSQRETYGKPIRRRRNG